MNPPKIYTYHESLEGFPDQAPLIDVWKESWIRHGFEPVVLGVEHAEQHPMFEQLDGWEWLMNSVNPWPYTRACYRRWMAYATVGGDVRFADYDVINCGLSTKEVPIARPHGLWLGDRSGVPCFGVVPRIGLESLIRMFRNVATLRQAGPLCVRDDLNDMNLIRDFADYVSKDLVMLHGAPQRRPLIHFAHACFPDGNRIEHVTQWWSERRSA